jgi:parallel beta-helix repeat protein
MYMKGWCDGTSDTIRNNVQVKYTLFDGGGKPAIKWEGGCATIGPGNIFRNKLRTAIRLYTNAGHSGEAAIIQGNEFYGNGIDGGTNTAYAQIHTQTDATAGRYILIKNNLIYDAAYASGFGIGAGSDDNIYLTGNEVYGNPFAGFKLGTWGTKDDPDNPHTGQITISGETNYTFAGTAYTDGSPNKFHSNGRGGIATSVVSNFSIIKNEIYNNGWGGIHTGWLEPVDGEFTWPGGSTTAVMDIRTNKVYGNGAGTDTAGGGIDVMYASGSIENNLVYENKYAGIRVGDGVLSGMIIRHNTVVDNGGGTTPDQAVAGGGIVYHDGYAQDGTTPCYYCRPYGTIPLAINVKDNVIAYTANAALPGMGYPNTVGSEERDYNLIYSNNPGAWFWTADCGYVAAGGDYSTGQIDYKCLSGQYGFNPLYWDNSVLKTQDPNDILAPPLFTDRANDDYRLCISAGNPDPSCTGTSPGSGAASDIGDMGAWGGTSTYRIDW